MLQKTDEAEHETKADPEGGWRSFVRHFLIVFIGGLGSIYAFILVVDPYDTGRFPALPLSGVADDYKPVANVSRARNPRFNSAVIGNSHGQLLDPTRLSQSTGLRFVQLTTPGSGPREQLTTLRWFMRHHADIAAVIVTIDNRWCSSDPAIPVTYPFPFWLYEDDLTYLANVLSTRSLSAARRRLMLAFGHGAAADPTGAWDYEVGREWNFKPAMPPDYRPAQTSASDAEAAADMRLPPLDRLDATAASIPRSTRIVLVMPPVFYTGLPPEGSRSAAELTRCKSAYARWAKRRPGAVFLDFLTDTPMSRDPHNFMDMEHYRADFARAIEARIAASLNGAALSARP